MRRTRTSAKVASSDSHRSALILLGFWSVWGSSVDQRWRTQRTRPARSARTCWRRVSFATVALFLHAAANTGGWRHIFALALEERDPPSTGPRVARRPGNRPTAATFAIPRFAAPPDGLPVPSQRCARTGSTRKARPALSRTPGIIRSRRPPIYPGRYARGDGTDHVLHVYNEIRGPTFERPDHGGLCSFRAGFGLPKLRALCPRFERSAKSADRCSPQAKSITDDNDLTSFSKLLRIITKRRSER